MATERTGLQWNQAKTSSQQASSTALFYNHILICDGFKVKQILLA